MAKKKQTDNDAQMFEVKIDLRQDLIKDMKEVRVLEAFAGDGAIWGEIKRRNPDKKNKVLRIDQKPDKVGVYLKGDNTKFMGKMDLTKFDLIDLDAYGSPYNQLELVFASNYQGPVVCTFIQTMQGGLNKQLLIELGYSRKMIEKCPSLFSTNGFDKMKAYLAKKGVKKVKFYSQNRKNYFSFFRKKSA